jgi:hypothetical protein
MIFTLNNERRSDSILRVRSLQMVNLKYLEGEVRGDDVDAT